MYNDKPVFLCRDCECTRKPDEIDKADCPNNYQGLCILVNTQCGFRELGLITKKGNVALQKLRQTAIASILESIQQDPDAAQYFANSSSSSHAT